MSDNEEDLEQASWKAGVVIEAVLPATPPAVWGNEVERELDLVT